ncbi:MAGUK p55 subfamily member 2 isoform X7 [Numida meleagris]|uniref:MAGUK p55 subfamily member 2 isoform X7 n=1 Tax=Numida meleagris TaxID=8996 RepID=UPI000B3E106B|nr:MAGUK p55 subfamily member 2 isoform X7 [Numida meleagris]
MRAPVACLCPCCTPVCSGRGSGSSRHRRGPRYPDLGRRRAGGRALLPAAMSSGPGPGASPTAPGAPLGPQAMQQVLDNLLSLPSTPGAADLDLIFLRGIMESPIVRSLAKVQWRKAHERLEETKLEAVRDNNVELVQEILSDIGHLVQQDSAAAELACILREPHFQSLLETHDSVASKSYETPPPSPVLDPTFNNQPVPPDAVRMVGIRKTAGENLVFVKCHFDYDPASDSLIPCKEAGLCFTAGDLLQIVNQDDPNWWQACHVEGGSAGLIPSQLLEEKRKAFVKRDVEVAPTPAGALCSSLSGKRKKRMMYLTTKNAEFDRHELLIYEEVARMPPFRRKTLVLIGAQGVGRRSLKNKLIMSDQARYGTTIPYTSRKPKESEKDGHGYHFVSRGEMEADIKAGHYLEHGEYEGNLYGTKIDSIRAVVNAGKMCILDVNPQAVKVLRTAEFVPYVVFIEAPSAETLRAMNRAALESGVAIKQLTEADARRTVEESSRIQHGYSHYFDLSLTNDNLEHTFGQLREAMERLRAEPQWVPVTWVY